MIETKMPKDIRSYKTKVVGPFTLREAFCIFLMIIANIILYALVIRPLNLPLEFTVYGFFLVCVPFVAIGWWEVSGMPLEKYFTNVILRMLASPVKRKVSSPINVTKVTSIENEDCEQKTKSKKKNKKVKNKKNSEPVDPLMKGFM